MTKANDKCTQLTILGRMLTYFNHTNFPITNAFHVYMKDIIDKSVLEEALEHTRRRFPQFSVRLRGDDRGYFLEYLDRPYTLLDLDTVSSKFLYLGSDDTHGHLISIACGEKCLRFDFYHPLTDGMPFLEFIKTALYYYLTLKGCTIDTEGIIFNNETMPYSEEEVEDPDTKLLTRTPPLLPKIGKLPESFQIPKDMCRGSNFPNKACKVLIPLAELKRVAKHYESSPVCLVAPLFSRALYRQYVKAGVNDELPIITNVVDNFRKNVPTKTSRLFVYRRMLPYNTAFLHYPISKVLTVESGRLSLLTEPDIVLEEYCEFAEYLRSVFLNDELTRGEKQMIVNKEIAPKLTKANTFNVSNIGKIRMPKDMDKYISSIECWKLSSEDPYCVTMVTVGDNIEVMITSSMDDYEEVVLDFNDYLQLMDIDSHIVPLGNYYFLKFDQNKALAAK